MGFRLAAAWALALVVVAAIPLAEKIDLVRRTATEPGGWRLLLEAADEALESGSIGEARIAWQEVYREAVKAKSAWEPMIAAADLALRLGETAGQHEAALPVAREMYLAAFFRAQRQGSAEGMLRASEAFARLGDGSVAEMTLGAARRAAAKAGLAEKLTEIRTVGFDGGEETLPLRW